MTLRNIILREITGGDVVFSWDKEQADKITNAVVNTLDKANQVKWRSLAGTIDQFKHCGLGIPIEEWQSLRS